MLLSSLFGAGAIGLRALATGLPASFLLNPRRALANGPCPTGANPQFVILTEDPALTSARLAMVRAMSLTIASGLGIFGVEPVEEMR